MNSILSIDPGPKHTAVILIDNIDYVTTTFNIAAKSIIQYPQRAKLLGVFERYKDQLDAIILEDFRLQPSKAQAQSYSRFETVKIIERITYQLESLALTHLLVMQQPGERYSATVFPPEHKQALYGNVDRKEQPHLYAAYQHARYFINMAKHDIPLPVVRCKACGWRSNSRMALCFNCDTKLPRNVLLDN